ncbi:MAG: protein-L-isoaspartate O-methyltransferase [Minisyncoccia bacterium]
MNTLENLVENLKEEGWLKNSKIIEAFLKIKREDFVIDKDLAYYNTALPIGFSQTISQPLVVAFMLELLSPEEGEKILDIGSGSGWTTALLAYCVGEGGKVIAIEIIPELKEFGENNVRKYNFIEKGIVKFILGDGEMGYKKEAPYDKILVSASTDKIPEELKNQLKIGGKLVMPINNSIVQITKMSAKEFKQKEYPGFIFVPLQ